MCGRKEINEDYTVVIIQHFSLQSFISDFSLPSNVLPNLTGYYDP